jgi:hypothetical protein
VSIWQVPEWRLDGNAGEFSVRKRRQSEPLMRHADERIVSGQTAFATRASLPAAGYQSGDGCVTLTSSTPLAYPQVV